MSLNGEDIFNTGNPIILCTEYTCSLHVELEEAWLFAPDALVAFSSPPPATLAKLPAVPVAGGERRGFPRDCLALRSSAICCFIRFLA